jgi:hypothetical protein
MENEIKYAISTRGNGIFKQSTFDSVLWRLLGVFPYDSVRQRRLLILKR